MVIVLDRFHARNQCEGASRRSLERNGQRESTKELEVALERMFCFQAPMNMMKVTVGRDVTFQDEIRDLVLRTVDTKHEFYKFVSNAWDLEKDSNFSIHYESTEYQWDKSPVRGHDAKYSWNETMFWISLKIHHRALGEFIWSETDEDWKSKNLLNVSYLLTLLRSIQLWCIMSSLSLQRLKSGPSTMTKTYFRCLSRICRMEKEIASMLSLMEIHLLCIRHRNS